jgi:AcrR family transcriptional regulator
MKSTEDRILAAATVVFGRKGIMGATTREIARRARVNEVTLFRHFKNKNELLRRVIQQSCRRFEPVFAEAPIETAADLRSTIENFVTVYSRKLSDNEELVRTFIGEITRYPKLSRSLFVEAGRTVRQKFVAYLAAAQKNGLVRADIDVTTAADALTAMLMGGMLRRPLTVGEYEMKTFVKTCVKLYLKGIQP